MDEFFVVAFSLSSQSVIANHLVPQLDYQLVCTLLDYKWGKKPITATADRRDHVFADVGGAKSIP